MSEDLADPIGTLRPTEFDWDDHDALILDERYRQRHVPLLRTDTRPPMAADPIRPGEFWPPVRAVVLPLTQPALHLTAPISAFLADMRQSAVAEFVWWPGLEMRAGLVHATLTNSRLPNEMTLRALSAIPPPDLVVRGPWLGQHNLGRIYLPVGTADNRSAAVVGSLLTAAAIENRPLLSGFLQLTHDVEGVAYRELRDIVRAHQTRITVPVRCRELWMTDTMDDLMLRSTLVNRYPFAAG